MVRATTVIGQLHEEIALFTATEQIDLIVISTVEKSRFRCWLMRSVAKKVAYDVGVPLLLVPTHKDKKNG